MKRRHREKRRIKVLPDVLFSYLDQDLSPWLPEGSPGPEATVKQFAAWQMKNSFRKKFLLDKSPDADQKALDKFLQVNQRCKDWELRMVSWLDELLIGELKSTLVRFFEPNGQRDVLITSFDDLFRWGKVGPGVSILANGNDFYSKLFSSRLTTTSPGLYHAYKCYIRNFPEWNIAESIRASHFGEVEVVSGNRVTFVPKTSDISRTICVEPSLNMFAQLGVKHILERRLKRFFGIDLASQQFKNRELARLGSKFDRRNSSVTIDLTSASDSMSTKMLKEVIPASAMNWFNYLRAPASTLPNGDKVELGMVSTMGNGYTFPLQTILFSAIVVAAARVYDRPLRFPFGKRLGNFGVNGDDIICEKSISRGVLRLLELLGFEVNRDKTFIEGPFRESCGGDFYHGQAVRGFYLKDLESASSRCAAINGLNLWSARTGIYLPRTVQYLASSVEYLPVPLWENQDAGVKLPLRCLNRRPRTLQGSFLYRRLEPVAAKVVVSATSDVIFVPAGHKPLIYNPSGLLISVLNSSISSTPSKGGIMFFSVRHDRKKWRTKSAIAPNWEHSHSSSSIALEERSSRWEAACCINMGV